MWLLDFFPLSVTNRTIEGEKGFTMKKSGYKMFQFHGLKLPIFPKWAVDLIFVATSFDLKKKEKAGDYLSDECATAHDTIKQFCTNIFICSWYTEIFEAVWDHCCAWHR